LGGQSSNAFSGPITPASSDAFLSFFFFLPSSFLAETDAARNPPPAPQQLPMLVESWRLRPLARGPVNPSTLNRHSPIAALLESDLQRKRDDSIVPPITVVPRLLCGDLNFPRRAHFAAPAQPPPFATTLTADAPPLVSGLSPSGQKPFPSRRRPTESIPHPPAAAS